MKKNNLQLFAGTCVRRSHLILSVMFVVEYDLTISKLSIFNLIK